MFNVLTQNAKHPMQGFTDVFPSTGPIYVTIDKTGVVSFKGFVDHSAPIEMTLTPSSPVHRNGDFAVMDLEGTGGIGSAHGAVNGYLKFLYVASNMASLKLIMGKDSNGVVKEIPEE